MALTMSEYKRNFFASEAATEIREELERMMSDPKYNTKSFYTPLQIEDQTFADKHMNYLSIHPNLRASEYLANLRLMTKMRT